MTNSVQTIQRKKTDARSALEAIPPSVAIEQYVNTLAQTSRSLFTQAYGLLADMGPQMDADAVQALIELADAQVQALETFSKQQHVLIAGLAETLNAVTEERDLAIKAYRNAFEAGIAYAYEAENAMDEMAVECLFNDMLETSVEEVAIRETERLNERLAEAASYAQEEYDSDETSDLVQARNEQKAAFYLIDDQVFDPDHVDYNQIQSEQSLMQGLSD